MICGGVNEAPSMSRPIDGGQGRFATHGVCMRCKSEMADPTEREGVIRDVHHARRKNCRATARIQWIVDN
jgi:hypothetical protein